MPEQPHFLATPKGVFVMGLVVGAMSVLSLGFVLTVSGSLNFGQDVPAAQIAAITPPPSAPPLDTRGGNVGVPRPVTKDDHIRGAGKITVIEYGDYECPFCQQFHVTMQQVMAMSSIQVRWVFRHFPLTSIHPDAEPAAEAAECAGAQGKFWEMTDAIYAHQSEGLGAAKLAALAKGAGVKDMSAWTACVTNHTYADRITTDALEATSIGAEGTPYSVVVNEQGNSQEIPGALPISNVRAILDALSK